MIFVALLAIAAADILPRMITFKGMDKFKEIFHMSHSKSWLDSDHQMDSPALPAVHPAPPIHADYIQFLWSVK